MAIKLEISSVHGTFSTLNTFQLSSGRSWSRKSHGFDFTLKKERKIGQKTNTFMGNRTHARGTSFYNTPFEVRLPPLARCSLSPIVFG